MGTIESDAALARYDGTAAPGLTPFVALLVTAPSDDAGTGLVECSYVGYARVAVAFGAAAAGPSGSRQKENNAVVEFAVPVPAEEVLGGYAIFDAAVGGNLLRAVAAAVVLALDETPRFPVGAITLIQD